FSGDLGRVAGDPAAMLSGNPPLVHVLREALAEDAAGREGSKKEARRRAQAALQTLLGYLKQHGGEKNPPPEHVIVYDEAQRAWDEETGKKLLGRLRSEPALFLEIMSRHLWSCLVCLVGPGQEINRGEGGLPLWGQALSEAAAAGIRWRVHAAGEAIKGDPATTGNGLFVGVPPRGVEVIEESDLHLSTGLRAYRNADHGWWVSAVLRGEIAGASDLASRMTEPPAYITRDLDTLRTWLRKNQRGGRRVGLLTSSGAAIRLISEGIPLSPRSSELDAIAHWFLRPVGDFRSSNALETPLTEFACQGLEIDYVGLCWGGDLIWNGDQWLARTMRAPKWQIIRSDETKQYRLNAYRVLLTRARAGLAIFVPNGDQNDASREPSELQRTWEVLCASGCKVLGN
ncbi:MAG: DNA/RNA helicase domain-containing protein, partial [Candidatus Acidiferrales bacterium]